MAKAKLPSVGRRILTLILGAVAAKLAMSALEQIWTKGLRQDLPDRSEQRSLLKKVAWVGLAAATVTLARELVRELVARSPGATQPVREAAALETGAET